MLCLLLESAKFALPNFRVAYSQAPENIHQSCKFIPGSMPVSEVADSGAEEAPSWFEIEVLEGAEEGVGAAGPELCHFIKIGPNIFKSKERERERKRNTKREGIS